jgi:hypothetical protein
MTGHALLGNSMTALDSQISVMKDRIKRFGIGCVDNNSLLTIIIRPAVMYWLRKEPIVQSKRRQDFRVGFACDSDDDDRL